MKRTTIIVLTAAAVLIAFFVIQREREKDIIERLNVNHLRYMNNEYPEKGKMFASMVNAMSAYVDRTNNVARAELLKWLGKPDDEWDEVDGKNGKKKQTALVYFYEIDGHKNLAFFVYLDGENGIVNNIVQANVPPIIQ